MSFNQPSFAPGKSSQERPPVPAAEKAPALTTRERLEKSAEHFLGNQRETLSLETVADATARAEEFHAQLETYFAGDFPQDAWERDALGKPRTIGYDKRKSAFLVDGAPAADLTLGKILASRHLEIPLLLPESLNETGIGKKMRTQYIGKTAEDALYDMLNLPLAGALAARADLRNTDKAKGYRAIEKRSHWNTRESETQQLGVLAEKICIGIAEMIAIDIPELGLAVLPGNAYEDMEEKVDFIIESKIKRRGVGVQFTTNTNAAAHKMEQIRKAKERGINLDDIVYVELDGPTLKDALRKWKAAGSGLEGPWEYLPTATQKQTLQKLFHEVITAEQEANLMKGFDRK